MSQHEYYIRQPSDAESRGPFTFEQLSDLANSGGLNTNTLYFDANADQWISINEAPDLAVLVRGKQAPQTPSPALAASAASLASAASPASAEPAPLASKLLVVLLAVSGVVLLLPAFLTGGEPAPALEKLLAHPAVWLGALDVLLALCCLAFGARFFRFVRIRAGLGLGFLGSLFWLQANTGALAAALIASACLWLATSLASARALAVNTIAGLAALGALAYCLLS